MAPHQQMPVPQAEMSPQALCNKVRDWAEAQGYGFVQGAHASEFAKVTVTDPAGGHSTVVVPNAHHGRRLRRDQVRYTALKLDANWKD
jgi:hypothetical protein